MSRRWLVLCLLLAGALLTWRLAVERDLGVSSGRVSSTEGLRPGLVGAPQVEPGPQSGEPGGSGGLAGGPGQVRQPPPGPDQAHTDAAPLVLGRVLAPSGAPAAGARIFARTGGWYSIVPLELEGAEGPAPARQATTADDSGRFAFDAGLDPGEDLSWSVVAPGCVTERQLRRPFPSAPLDLGTLQLRAGAQIEGRLVDGGGAPVAGASVLLGVRRGVAGNEGSFPGQGSPVGTSDPDGRFRVDGLAPGPWELLFEAPGLCVAERQGHLASGEQVHAGEISLLRGDTIRGRIAGLPAALAPELWVEARSEELEPSSRRRGRRALPGPDGSFAIPGLHPGRRVRVRVLEPSPAGGWVPVATAPQPIVPSSTADLEIPWGLPLALTARVVDRTGAPIEHFRAFADLGYFGGTHGIGEEGADHPDGRLVASGMRLYSEEATPRLLLRAAGFEDHEQEVTGLTPGSQVDLGTIELRAAPRLLVRVEDPHGAPVAGAELWLGTLGPGHQPGQTNAAGSAVLTASSEREEVLHVRHPRWPAAAQGVPALTGASAEVRVTLQEACRLVVRVQDPGGAPLSGYPVQAQALRPDLEPDQGVDPIQGTTESDGTLTWKRLAPGWYRIGARAEPLGDPEPPADASPRSHVVELAPARPSAVTLVGAPQCEVYGVVRDASGPLGTATLRLGKASASGEVELPGRDGWRTRFNRVSSAHGEFRFTGVPRGDYVLEIEHDARAMLARVPVRVLSPEQELPIELPSATLSVRVVDQGGGAIHGAEVELTTGEPGGPNPNRAWNDGRRAWTDERGDLQQSWHQDALHLRTTGAEGWARFPGCLPDIDLHLRLTSQWLVAARPTERLRLQEGTERALPAPLVAYPAGSLLVHRADANQGSLPEARIAFAASPAAPAELRQREGLLAAGPCRLTRLIAGPCTVTLLLRGPDQIWRPTQSLTLDLVAGNETVLEADLEHGRWIRD